MNQMYNKLSIAKPYSIHYMKRLLMLIEFLLFMRFALKWLDANSETFIIRILYGVTEVMIWPFNAIFPDIRLISGSVIDVVALSAMIGYFIFIFLCIGVIYSLVPEEK